MSLARIRSGQERRGRWGLHHHHRLETRRGRARRLHTHARLRRTIHAGRCGRPAAHKPWWRHPHHRLLGSEAWGRCDWWCEDTCELALVRYGCVAHRRGRNTTARSAKCAYWSGGRTRCYRKSVILPCLSRQQSFGRGAVPLALSVLLERVLDRDSLVHEELVVHLLDCRVCRFEIRIRHKSIAFRLASRGVSSNLGEAVSKSGCGGTDMKRADLCGRSNDSEAAERFI